MKHHEKIRLKVTGDYACFTRPDLKVERFSYPCMTPSAARGILSAILWKKEFKWWIEKIEILKPIVYMNIKRNELKPRQSNSPVYIEDVHTPRNSIILKDVSYIIEASIYQEVMDVNNTPKKYYEMFTRRVKKGQCYRQPYFGQREYSLDFSLAGENDKASPDITVPIGSMLFDMIYDEKGVPSPLYFYDVAIQQGIVSCPNAENEKLMKSHDILPSHTDAEMVLRKAYLYDKGVEEEKGIEKDLGL